MGETWSSLFPPPARLTEKELGNQSGKVFIVTGASGGLGRHLVDILYQHNGKIYVAARSEAKASTAIKEIRAKHPESTGELVFLHLDLNDLTTIKRTAQEFLSKESRLDVLWNNAGVMVPPQGSKTAQGYELQLGTNNVAPFLLTKLLLPVLKTTAKVSPRNTVRVVWVSSSAAQFAPKPAIDFSNINYTREESIWPKYMRSKAGNVLHSAELARRTRVDGIISLSLNPGNFVTGLHKTMPRWQLALFKFVAKNPVNGAYTELYAGLSEDITEKNSGGWVAPFGRLTRGPTDLFDPELGRKYWEWSEEQIKPYE
ncbi:hypothetical protein V1517DRAFT_328031 [Lipomyces orientalis]|uniref:Uncharacterized protein n=1 Tax=Lipomyces orientalis TaxID=1233043 RepID=A0ACC3TI49_9ASCO